MIKIEFPADRRDLAEAFGRALLEVAKDEAAEPPKPQQPAGRGGRAEDVDDPGADQPTTPPEDSPAVAQVDTANGVPYNAEFCSSGRTMYSSGKNLCQWVKKKGLPQEAYDAWYAEELAKLKPRTVEEDEPVIDAVSVFAATPVEPAPTITDGNSLMLWVSQQQALGALSDTAFNEALKQLNIQPLQLLTDASGELARQIYGILNAARTPSAQ